ncbi:MAG TPA: lactate utilization protein [Bryobacteraceae bacterium]|nr:lactate utilization protein [Bryobacteraceae bacterium]
MTSREEILGNIRAALKRQPNEPVPSPPPALLREGSADNLVDQFKTAFEALGGNAVLVKTAAEAQIAVEELLNGRTFMTSVKMRGGEFSRDACASAEVGITSADYALADTGSLVIFTESGESRLLSLLPPCHIAVIERSKIVPSLDDLLRQRPMPGENSSAMVIITGPSRTGDIEMRLVRGVHGPGEVHVVIVDEM